MLNSCKFELKTKDVTILQKGFPERFVIRCRKYANVRKNALNVSLYLILVPKKGDLINLDNWNSFMLIVSPPKTIIAIMDNKVQALKALIQSQEALKNSLRMASCYTRAPSGVI